MEILERIQLYFGTNTSISVELLGGCIKKELKCIKNYVNYEFFVLVMEFETLKQIDDYEAANVLTDEQRRALFERRMQIFLRIHQWREENERLGLAPDLTWTPEQRERILRDWQNDEVFTETNHGEKRTYDEMMDEEPSTSHQGALQTGRGEVDGDHERPFYVESVRQVYTKKFRTNATSYRVQFTIVFANVETTSLHEQLHDLKNCLTRQMKSRLHIVCETIKQI